MRDIVLTGILHAGITGFLLLLIQRRIQLKAWWLLYLLILTHHVVTYSIPAFSGSLSQNWQGKGTIALLSLVFIFTYTGTSKADYGWSFKINRNSLLPVLAGTVFMALLLNLPGYLQHTQAVADTEKLLYLSTLPGFAEELVYRGIFLALLNKGLGRWYRVAGAEMGWGSLLVAVLYGCFHGLSIRDSYHLGHNEMAFALTFLSGFFFCWVRERTGSLWPAMVSHNLINLAGLL